MARLPVASRSNAGPRHAAGPDLFALAIDQNGQATGLSFTNSTPNSTTGIPTLDPFFWDGTKMIDLGTLGGAAAIGGAPNNWRQVVGVSDVAGDVAAHAFFWESGVLTDIGTSAID